MFPYHHFVIFFKRSIFSTMKSTDINELDLIEETQKRIVCKQMDRNVIEPKPIWKVEVSNEM